ncbi:MAG: YkgJ family cysteine cluster protein [Pyrinomonadaceae bacterium MAG19_C2-C3]|nr:YkgJ family cysteine cluster protein [Pyrinomonadaceae bacterium MAG19_C2-C3]
MKQKDLTADRDDTNALGVIIECMNESSLIQITRRRQIGSTTYERLVGHLVGEMEKRLHKPQIAAMRLSGKLADKIVDSPSGGTPNCHTCGACCGFYTCVAVEDTDTVPRSHYWKIGERAGAPVPIARRQLRRDAVTNNCIALEGEIGKAVRCGIYRNRPAACRDFEADSDQCHAARRAFGLEPPLTAEQLAKALRRLAAREAKQRRREAMNCVSLVSINRQRVQAVESRDKEILRDLITRREAV